MTSEIEREYVDDRDLEERFGIVRATWQQWRCRNQGPPWYKVGRRVLYKLAEVRTFVEVCRVGKVGGS